MRITYMLMSKVFVFVLVAMSIVACSDPNKQAMFNNAAGKHADGWLPSGHKDAALSGTSTCKQCHGDDLSGGIAGVSCTSCHIGNETHVHPQDWSPVYSKHGPYAKANTTTRCANQYCHGKTLSGVSGSGPSCMSCHLGSSTSVHPSEWSGKILLQHGPYVGSHSTSSCSNQYCHGTDLSGVNSSGPSCTSCHIGGSTHSHPPDWAQKAISHGPYVRSNGTSGCANESCHGNALSGISGSGPSCTKCHLGGATTVHPKDWVPISTTHGPYVKANTTSACANQYCHGTSLTGVAGSGSACTLCHIGDASNVHPSDWVPVYSTHGVYAASHGSSSCANQLCHGTSLTGVTGSGPSCTLCHIGSAMNIHPTSWSPVYSTHGPYVAQNGTTSCANQYCHGGDLKGISNSGPSCTSCHMGSPTEIHPSEWNGDACSNHGNYAYTNGTAGCASIYCHGKDLSGVTQSGPSCTKCHSPIPSSNRCNLCHGSTPNAMPDGTSFPNIAGKHANHMQITGVGCMTCHDRSCDLHANGTVDVVFDPAGLAVVPGGPAPVFNATSKSCLNVACHVVPSGTFSYAFPGGEGLPEPKTVNVYGNPSGSTPGWYDSVRMCAACHGDPPSQSPSGGYYVWHSGQHAYLGPTGKYNQCQLCHPDASSPGNAIGDTITDPSLHGNGTIDVQPIWSSECFNCH